jgi:hypothetical protein
MKCARSNSKILSAGDYLSLPKKNKKARKTIAKDPEVTRPIST